MNVTDNVEEAAQEPEGDDALTARQELALQALISSPTQKDAARAAGIGETTLWRYMRDEKFSSRLREARSDALAHAAVRLQGASSDAVTVLRDLMMREEAPAASRITAARAVVDYSFRVVEMDDLKRRFEDLERFILRKQEADALERASGGGKEG